jgi:hypothetical protein
MNGHVSSFQQFFDKFVKSESDELLRYNHMHLLSKTEARSLVSWSAYAMNWLMVDQTSCHSEKVK